MVDKKTKTFFIRVCSEFVKMNKEETDRCVDKLLELEPEYLTRDTSHIYYFMDEHLLQAMMENPTFRKMKEKQRYQRWDDVVSRVEYWNERTSATSDESDSYSDGFL